MTPARSILMEHLLNTHRIHPGKHSHRGRPCPSVDSIVEQARPVVVALTSHSSNLQFLFTLQPSMKLYRTRSWSGIRFRSRPGRFVFGFGYFSSILKYLSAFRSIRHPIFFGVFSSHSVPSTKTNFVRVTRLLVLCRAIRSLPRTLDKALPVQAIA